MERKQALPDETQALRRCLRDLAALSTLSAVWSQRGAREIAEGLAGVLFRALPLDFAYVRLLGREGEVAAEATRTHHGPVSAEQSQEIAATLEPLLKSGRSDQITTIDNPFGNGTLRLAIIPVGFDGDSGVLVVGSQQSNFPSQIDHLLLAVAANQAAIVLHQQRAEEELRRSERELADFFHNATLGLHWVGADGTILRANRAELELLGYSPEEYIGHRIVEFHADREVIDDILRRLQAGEELHDYEARLRCKDGSIKHVLINSSVLWDDGKFVHTRCFTRDVTDRKRAERALRRSEERFRLMAETVPSMVWTAAPEGTITYANERWFEYCGLTPEQNARGWPELVLHPDDRQRCVEQWTRALRDCTAYEVEVRNRRHDGTYRWFITRAVPWKDAAGEVVSWFGVTTDIHDQKQLVEVLRQSEEALRKHSERLRLLWEAAAVMLTADDPDLMLRGLLAKIGPHLGVDSYFNYLVSDAGDALQLASCEGISVEKARTMARLQFGQDICGKVALHRQPIAVTEIQKSDDPQAQLVKSCGIRAYASNPLLAGAKLLGTLSFASHTRDQFDRDELAFLETICHYATVAFERLRLLNELKVADRQKDEFLAMLAHELRNPLAPIRSGLDVLGIEEGGANRRTIELMQEQVEHLVRLVDDLLDVSRIMRGKIEIRKETVELSALIHRSVQAVRPLIETHQQELSLSLPEQPVWLHADPVRLLQIVENLLNNASKYTDSGGRIELIAERQDDQAVIEVRDSGIGIETELLPRIFDLFTQSSRSLDRAQGGLGIGLTLVQRLVWLHEGRISVVSDGPGHGSTFTVHFPVVEAPAQVEKEVRSFSPAQRQRVVVVDDNDAAASLLATLLKKLDDHEVKTAHDGPTALQIVKETQPDIVLCDIGLPGMDGYQVARDIRLDHRLDDMLLVALTGYGREEDRRKSQEAGFDEHLVKPPSVDQLRAVFAHAKLKKAGRLGPALAAASAPPVIETTPSPARNAPLEATHVQSDLRQIKHDIGNTAHVLILIGKMLSESQQRDRETEQIVQCLEREAEALRQTIEKVQRLVDECD